MKKIITIAVVIILLGTGGVYAYNAGLMDVFLTPDTAKAKDFAKLVAFPETIGQFKRAETFISVEDRCDDLEKSADASSRGLSGHVCTRDATAMYRDDSTNESVFIHLGRITEGHDAYVKYMRAFSTPDSIGTYPVVRVEQHELAWFPREVFDILVTQEGQFTEKADGNLSMRYDRKATGTNVVTQYFLQKYPPVAELNPTK